jgi:hypothetical protein
MMRFLTIFVLCLALGCAAAPFVSPLMQIGIMWVEGEAHKYYFSDKADVERAVRGVIKDMELDIKKDTVSKDGIIHLEVDNKKMKKSGEDRRSDVWKIKIDPVRHNVTELSIRVDIMGDKPYAELFYKEVDKYKGIRCFRTTHELKTAMATE